MFKKEKCKKCEKSISKEYDFCPYCGIKTDSREEDYGMLGKNDFLPAGEIKLPVGFNALFNSLIKSLSHDLDKQLKENYLPDKPKSIKKDGISISISTFGGGQPKIKVMPIGNKESNEAKPQKNRIKAKSFTKEEAGIFSSLPKEEPKTSVRRFSNKVVYEIEMPDVANRENISIVNLENSIEIKAIGKKYAYVKRIPINLPISSYDLSDGKLTLELDIKN